MPTVTVQQALGVLRTLSEQADAARAAWERARADRDALIEHFDGQEGISRSAMAEACGISRVTLWKMLERRPESVEEDVVLSDALRDALQEALAGVWIDPTDRRIDVHA
jgi:hypothetical protein